MSLKREKDMSRALEFHVDVDAVLEGLEKMRTENGMTKRELRRLIGKELSVARREVAKAAKSAIGADPRQAWKGVKSVQYKKKALGGMVAILEPRGKVWTSNWQRPKKARAGKIGGNRMKRSAATIKRDSYWGASRAFVLRFLNSGTQIRRTGKQGKRYTGANRGLITGKGWFETSATAAAERAAARIVEGVKASVTKRFG